jgi:hypothetical protein
MTLISELALDVYKSFKTNGGKLRDGCFFIMPKPMFLPQIAAKRVVVAIYLSVYRCEFS